MKITYLGHSGFRIETGARVLLLDPWLRGNPVFDEANFDRAIEGTTHILVSHGHSDHASNVPEIAKATGAVVVGIYEYAVSLGEAGVENAMPMSKGGTVDLGGVEATMVHAIHSSSTDTGYSGSEAGYMITAESKTIYFAGDTDVMSDMALFQELHSPEIGIIPIGGRFTMDAKRAAFACNKFFDFECIIPCHYKTFDLLAQSADEFIAAVAPTPVHALDSMGSIEL